MRKKLARYGIVVILVLVAFAASSLAFAHTRSAVVADGERSAQAADSSSQGALTVLRLLQSRLGWTLQLARALRSLELPPAPPFNGTLTIIDEPDPAGAEDTVPPNTDQDEQGPPDVIEDDSPSSHFEPIF